MATVVVKKEKCKYWDKCYRKDPVHKNKFLHPAEEKKSADASETWYEGSSRVDLRSKEVVFTGTLTAMSRQRASARAKMFGCVVETSVTKSTDTVIMGKDPRPSVLDSAKKFGVKCVSEEEWESILRRSKPVRGYKASKRNKDAAKCSDSEDEDFEPGLKKKRIPAVRKKDKT